MSPCPVCFGNTFLDPVKQKFKVYTQNLLGNATCTLALTVTFIPLVCIKISQRSGTQCHKQSRTAMSKNDNYDKIRSHAKYRQLENDSSQKFGSDYFRHGKKLRLRSNLRIHALKSIRILDWHFVPLCYSLPSLVTSNCCRPIATKNLIRK